MNYIKYNTYSNVEDALVIEFKGYNLNYTNFVYLSVNDLFIAKNYYNTEYVNFFSSNELLSSSNPGFSGSKYFNYEVISPNEIFFYLQNLTGAAIYDIVVFTNSGYTKLSDQGF